MVTTPWYKDGLRFKCTQCGDCCRWKGEVYVNDDDIKRLAEWANIPFELCKFEYTTIANGRRVLVSQRNGACIMLDSEGKCKCQSHKPIQCSAFPWFSDLVATPESWDYVSRHCEGCNKGDIVPLEQIEKMRTATDELFPSNIEIGEQT